MIPFEQISVGSYFKHYGFLWLKRSTKTAIIVEPVERKGGLSYFRKRERVELIA